jgi:hypothetical protein
MRSSLSVLLAILMSQLPYVAAAEMLPERAPVEMIPTATIVEQMSRAEARQRVERVLGDQEIRTKLAELGMSPDEMSVRLATLSDTELRQLASQIDQARYGGDSITGILVLVVLVLLIIYLAKRI